MTKPGGVFSAIGESGMSKEQDNLAVIESFYRAYNEERIDDAVQMYAADGDL
jgi:hypothetical protein